jgi:arylsulfatase
MTQNQPNVLLICADHWPAELLGVAGHPAIKTPGLNELAKAGTRFTNCYSECPVCIPARRTLMTGMTPRSHGDRDFAELMRMPEATTLPQAFRDAGYQADAVGKLHVYPQRDRIGFDSVVLDEEGRIQFGGLDDYELFLGDEGFAGRHYDHGMSTNQYDWRPWHLSEHLHVTNWAARNMARVIKRRDPTKPGFWYLSFRHPHPPLVPLQSYVDLYRDTPIDPPYVGSWMDREEGALPPALAVLPNRMELHSAADMVGARRAFYALCTQIDHQIRWLIGTLRQEKLLDNTIIMFTSDHGDMLGNHRTVAKRLFYESSANIPLIILGTKDRPFAVGTEGGGEDHRLMGLQDVMPTLLDMCGLDVPDSVDGFSMASPKSRPHFYGEFGDGINAGRMVRDDRYKLIYYPAGNLFQLFDLEADPQEMTDLADDPAHREARSRLTGLLTAELHGSDLEWMADGALVGLEGAPAAWEPYRHLHFQRGDGWPPSIKV